MEWFVAQRDCARTTPKAPHHTGSLRVPIPPPKPATVVCVCVRAPPAALELRPRRERQVASHKTCPHALSRSPNPAHAPPARMPCVRVVGARSRTRRQRPRIIPSYSQRKTSTQPCAWAGRPTPFSFPEGPATRRGCIFFFFFFSRPRSTAAAEPLTGRACKPVWTAVARAVAFQECDVGEGAY